MVDGARAIVFHLTTTWKKKKRIHLNKSYLGVKGIKRNKQNYVLVKRCSGY